MTDQPGTRVMVFTIVTFLVDVIVARPNQLTQGRLSRKLSGFPRSSSGNCGHGNSERPAVVLGRMYVKVLWKASAQGNIRVLGPGKGTYPFGATVVKGIVYVMVFVIYTVKVKMVGPVQDLVTCAFQTNWGYE